MKVKRALLWTMLHLQKTKCTTILGLNPISVLAALPPPPPPFCLPNTQTPLGFCFVDTYAIRTVDFESGEGIGFLPLPKAKTNHSFLLRGYSMKFLILRPYKEG